MSGLVAAAGWALSEVKPSSGFLTGLWPSDSSAAGSLLQMVATGAVTITTLTFSITILALQLASQQFSPRLLREFARDSTTKQVLSVLSATFAFAVTGLRGVNSDQPVPILVCLVAALLGLASFAALLAFLTHMVKLLRVDTMMTRVHQDTDRAIREFSPPYGQPVPAGDDLGLERSAGRMLPARKSGYVQMTDSDLMVEAARRCDSRIRIEVRPGDHVVRGTPIATVWGPSGRPAPADVDDAVHHAVVLRYERTLDQDAAFGFRQLEDIAIKAMSPAINDPTTAVTAVAHMADLLVRLTGRRLGATLHEDENGVGRLIIPDRDLRYYLDLACGQLRRSGKSEPTVLSSLLRMLRDVAVSCRDDDQRTEVARAADMVAAELTPQANEADEAVVRDHRERVTAALEGRIESAFADRSGDTRSM